MSRRLSRDFALVIVGVRDLPDSELLVVNTSRLKGFPSFWNAIGAEEEIIMVSPGVLERVGITVPILPDDPL